MIKERLKALRALMEERNMDMYVIPTSDFHETEYVGEHFKARAYMSGFSGSSATLVVGKEKAALWTDGRYFIQAAKELEGTTIDLMKMGEPNVPTVVQYVFDEMKEGGCLGFDGRVMNTMQAKAFENRLEEKNATLSCDEDLVGMIWNDRPALPSDPAFFLDVKYCGKSSEDKIKDIREVMETKQADAHILTSLDDIAWTFNLRGNDIACFPVVLAYAVIEKETCTLFLDETKCSDEMKQTFANMNVQLQPYDAIYTFVKELQAKRVMLDESKVNYRITSTLPKDVCILNCQNPTQLMKAIKNEVELENVRHAHIKDGVAVTKFMYWLKNTIGKETITEYSASEKLEQFRREQENFIEISFDTIAAYNENAAMMHYHATEEKCTTLKPEGFLLVDSGGQYYEGTTDITRTFALGPISDVMKLHFTTVLQSMIQLSSARFLYGCTGLNLDILARGPIWNLDIDYKCGTGHGIGFVLNVHEAPNGFRWKTVAERNDGGVIEAGMITTNEPGIYLEQQYGIRIENELVAHKGEENEYGQFMHFETITFAPIDLDAIDTTLLSPKQKAWLNTYHAQVYEKISPFLNEEEKAWLKTYTRTVE